jgi:hypothetical protein
LICSALWWASTISRFMGEHYNSAPRSRNLTERGFFRLALDHEAGLKQYAPSGSGFGLLVLKI